MAKRKVASHNPSVTSSQSGQQDAPELTPVQREVVEAALTSMATESAARETRQCALFRERFGAASSAFDDERTNAKNRVHDLGAVEDRIDRTFNEINSLLTGLKDFQLAACCTDLQAKPSWLFSAARYLHARKHAFYGSPEMPRTVPFFRPGGNVSVLGVTDKSVAEAILWLAHRHVTHFDNLDLFPIDDGVRSGREYPQAWSGGQFNAVLRAVGQDPLLTSFFATLGLRESSESETSPHGTGSSGSDPSIPADPSQSVLANGHEFALRSAASNETPIDLKAAALLFRPNATRDQLDNWKKRGVKASGKTVILESYNLGGSVVTTKEAVIRFQAASNKRRA